MFAREDFSEDLGVVGCIQSGFSFLKSVSLRCSSYLLPKLGYLQVKGGAMNNYIGTKSIILVLSQLGRKVTSEPGTRNSLARETSKRKARLLQDQSCSANLVIKTG